MGTMPPEELLRQWEREGITADMAIGHLIQNMVKQQTAIGAINLTLYNLRDMVGRLVAHTGMKLNSKSKKKPSQEG